jgi:hypothetical protein
MPKETTKRIRKPGGWSTLRRQLATLGEARAARPGERSLRSGGERGGEALEKYRHKIVEQFYPVRGEAKLKLGEARKAVRDYRKATGNLHGTAELLMTYVENGAEFTSDYGDIDEGFYSSIESALDELAALLYGDAREMYPTFSERLARVERLSGDIGWGFHEYIKDVVCQLEEELGDQ